VDAVVHLAGLGIGDRRWSPEYKRAVLHSRIDATTTVATALAAAAVRDPARPRTLLSASAVGWYGDTGERAVDETAPSGTGFLAHVVRQWEQATEAAVAGGVRVVRLRTGLVCTRKGGFLSRPLPLARLGLLSPLGSGQQYWPWISLPDEVRAIDFLLGRADIAGAVNLTGPEPVRNADFTRTLLRLLHRPMLAPPVPAFALRLVLGDFADEGVLAGQRALPAVLERAGFPFRHRSAEAALRWVLERDA
jgi:uncharacterized protein (TIGR01777 family)